jgi:hypothetical protein
MPARRLAILGASGSGGQDILLPPTVSVSAIKAADHAKWTRGGQLCAGCSLRLGEGVGSAEAGLGGEAGRDKVEVGGLTPGLLLDEQEKDQLTARISFLPIWILRMRMKTRTGTGRMVRCVRESTIAVAVAGGVKWTWLRSQQQDATSITNTSSVLLLFV